MTSIKKLTLSAIFVAVSVVFSTFYIPVGVAKCFPIQHFINVLAGVLLGPLYAVLMAFTTSLIRNIMGTGSILAFPGSMVGALLCGLVYKYTKNEIGAFFGEIFGTGIIGALLAYPMARLFLAKQVAIFGFVIPFGVSTLVGSAISLVLILALKKTGVLCKLKLEVAR